jgi:hypothetical protein
MMHRVINGRIFRDVNLDTAADHEPNDDHESLGRLMRRRPTPHTDARVVRTSNGNLVIPVTR